MRKCSYNFILISLFALLLLFTPSLYAATVGHPLPSLTAQPLAIICLIIFTTAYLLVILEEMIDLRKSKPVVLAAGIIWILIGIIGIQTQLSGAIEHALKQIFLDYAELLLFLLVAMTYVYALSERNVFRSLQSWLISYHLSYRQLFWLSGIASFFLSPLIDNLTTALLMGAVVLTVGHGQKRFINLACINIVVAANAGGSFSPFGDITTLMVWQMEKIQFLEFFHLFIPALVNFLIPAFCLYFAVPKGNPKPLEEKIHMKIGAKRMLALFVATIITTVAIYHYLHLPPVLGMMLGLGYLKLLAFYIKRAETHITNNAPGHHKVKAYLAPGETAVDIPHFDIFKSIQNADWDTLLFFYGVMLCIGGLATLGYMGLVSHFLYNDLGAIMPGAFSATPANISVGALSAIVDNIPVMYAILNMNPTMSHGQWLLVTLTAGVGGSLLSIGSAAGIALMGHARGQYTFLSHFKWFWAIALGFIGSVAAHILINKHMFT